MLKSDFEGVVLFITMITGCFCLLHIRKYKWYARAGKVCLLGGVNHAQRRTNKPLGIGDCCQGDGVPITGQWTTLFVKGTSAWIIAFLPNVSETDFLLFLALYQQTNSQPPHKRSWARPCYQGYIT